MATCATQPIHESVSASRPSSASQLSSETAVPGWHVSVSKKRLKRRKKKEQSSEMAEPKGALASGNETVDEEMLFGSPSVAERTDAGSSSSSSDSNITMPTTVLRQLAHDGLRTSCTSLGHWANALSTFIGSLYNPPKPQYQSHALVSYVDGCVQELTHDFPTAEIVIAGDFNTLPEISVVAATGFTQIVRQPKHGVNVLDQMYVSDPLLFESVRVVKSVVKSDHLAVVAYIERARVMPANQTIRASYRRITPGQHAAFLQHFKDTDLSGPPTEIVQTAFDIFSLCCTRTIGSVLPGENDHHQVS